MLNSKDIRRYQRHFNLPKFGKSGQEMLKKANILVVGCGGLGGPVSLYLAAAGVGSMGILDFDIVTESNLQRQTQFSEEQIVNNKVDALKQRLEK